MLSAVIPSELSYPAMPLAEQLVHHRFVHSGPLVLGTDPFKIPTPTVDRDRHSVTSHPAVVLTQASGRPILFR